MAVCLDIFEKVEVEVEKVADNSLLSESIYIVNVLARFISPQFCNIVIAKYVHGHFHTFLVVPFIAHATRCQKVVFFKICSATDTINILIDCYSSRSFNSLAFLYSGKWLNFSDFKHSAR